MLKRLLVAVVAVLFVALVAVGHGEEATETVTFPSEDGLLITADVYAPDGLAGRPTVVLFHQARYSRGEYRDIAPRLNQLGFACLAVDQRSGDRVNGVINETARRARAEGKGTEFEDALQDMRAALSYARSEKGEGSTEAIIGWGSSYSSALILTIAADRPDLVEGTLSFSPGEYFSDRTLIKTAAAKVTVPAFITSARSERNQWKAILEALASPGKVGFVPTSAGRHGSSTLWPTTQSNEATWDAVESFLGQWLPSPLPKVQIDYQTETMNVTAAISGGPGVIEVSSDLKHWFAVVHLPAEVEEELQLVVPSSKKGVYFRAREFDADIESKGADVTAVEASGAAGSYIFRVTVSSPDTGCEQYADWWEVLNSDGELLYRRVLAHSHVGENPFSRSGGPVPIDADTVVWVRAHMNHSGYGGKVMKGSVAAGFETAELPAGFAPWVATEGSLPDGCAF